MPRVSHKLCCHVIAMVLPCVCHPMLYVHLVERMQSSLPVLWPVVTRQCGWSNGRCHTSNHLERFRRGCATPLPSITFAVAPHVPTGQCPGAGSGVGAPSSFRSRSTWRAEFLGVFRCCKLGVVAYPASGGGMCIGYCVVLCRRHDRGTAMVLHRSPPCEKRRYCVQFPCSRPTGGDLGGRVFVRGAPMSLEFRSHEAHWSHDSGFRSGCRAGG